MADEGWRRRKLGLALAGGGFRATLFHVGVVRRLAELDLLRRVEVLSAVSGGSIVAAHYALLLSQAMNGQARDLSRDEYVEIARRLERDVVAAVQQNLRLRLTANPWHNFKVIVSSATYGERMSRLYERYLFADVADTVRGFRENGTDEGDPYRDRPTGWIRLRDIRVDLPVGGGARGSLDQYNATRRCRQDADEQGGQPLSVVTALVLNATTLNSGGRFTFSTSEIGDSRLGLFRHDELEALLARKRWLESRAPEEVAEAARAGGRAADEADERSELDQESLRVLDWWRRGRWLAGRDEQVTEGGSAVTWTRGQFSGLYQLEAFLGELAVSDVQMGALRQVEAAARRYLQMTEQGSPQGEAAWDETLDGVRVLDPVLADAIRAYADDAPRRREVARFMVELYLLRAAERVSSGICEDWEELSLGDAVGASASFPPVFPPVMMTGIYDDALVASVGLTDGGVYDNTGIQGLLDAGCTEIIASDTGGVFRPVDRVSASRLRMMGRIVAVLRDVAGATQRGALKDRRRVTQSTEDGPSGEPSVSTARIEKFRRQHGLDELVYFHINSPPVAAGDAEAWDDLDRRALAALRTDLDSFGGIEIDLLVNHGYDMADRYVRRYLTSGWSPHARGRPRAAVDPRHEGRARRVILAGRSRFLRWARLTHPAVTAGIAAALVASAWTGWPWTFAANLVGDAWDVLADFARDMWAASPPWLGTAAERGRTAVGRVTRAAADWTRPALTWRFAASSVVALGGIVLFWASLRTWRPRRPPTSMVDIERRESRLWSELAKRRGWLGNLLWPLMLAPLWIPLVLSASSVLSRPFDRLFRWLAANPGSRGGSGPDESGREDAVV